jgi:hypothetical protein
MRLVAAFFVLLLLSGCATTPVPAASAQLVPPDRLLAGYAALATPSADSVRVVLVRDAGMLGSGPSAKLAIDGKEIAKLRTREKVEVFLKPGTYIFSVEPSPRLGGALVEKSFDIQTDKPRHFRISISEQSLDIQPSAQLE